MKMEPYDRGIAIILLLCFLLLAIVAYVTRDGDTEAEKCDDLGGIYFQTAVGYRCVKVEVIK